eukprot:scaffold72900_cov48-Cyclotella_meneghiniana.AAC.2
MRPAAGAQYWPNLFGIGLWCDGIRHIIWRLLETLVVSSSLMSYLGGFRYSAFGMQAATTSGFEVSRSNESAHSLFGYAIGYSCYLDTAGMAVRRDCSSLTSDKTAGWGLNVLLRGDECGLFIVAGQAAEYVRPDRGCYCHPVSG